MIVASLHVDSNLDVAYLHLGEDRPVVRTAEVSDGVCVDLDQMGLVVGIEMLSLGVEIPVDRLEREYHVHSNHVRVLRRAVRDVTKFSAAQSTDEPFAPVSREAADLIDCFA